MTITAIETRYGGCRFRSRLEARWAVFFDTLGIRWEYEPQGFDLGELGPYLPDFWLADHEAWFEVKGKYPDHDGVEYQKLRTLRDDSLAPVILAAGQIGDRTHWLFAHDLAESSGGAFESSCMWSGPTDSGLVGLAVDAASSRTFYGDTDFTRELTWVVPDYSDAIHPVAWSAYERARSARFEHGETPRPC